MNDKTLWKLATWARWGLMAVGSGLIAFGLVWVAYG